MAFPFTLNEVMLIGLGLQGYSGHLNTRLSAYFFDNGASPDAETLDGRELTCLQSQTGLDYDNSEQLWMEYLGSRGYTGTLNERKYQFWVDGGTFGPTALIRAPKQLMYDSDQVIVTVAGGASNPVLDMASQGYQAWTSGDRADVYVQGVGKVGFTEYQQVLLTLEAEQPFIP